jgi:hypothetical protein
LALSLAACGSAGAESDMADFKAQAINHSPLQREIAASVTFYSCAEHPSADFDALCEVCNVDLYPDKNLAFNEDPDTEAPVMGVKGWATHFYHEYKPWGDDPEPRISSTGERASKKFETTSLSKRAINVLFDEANAWCQDRRDGEFQVLKDEVDAFVEGLQ